MLKKIVLISILLVSSLVAEINIDVILFKNDSSYLLQNQDVLFEGDKIKFNFNLKKESSIETFYSTNNSDYKLLKKLNLKKNSSINFPGYR